MLVGSSVAKTVAPNNRLIAGAFGPGFPAKGMTASANIAYVQMKAILIVKAERAGGLRALMRPISAPLRCALISSPRQSLGCGIFNLFFRDSKMHKATHCATRSSGVLSCCARELLCRARSADGTKRPIRDVRFTAGFGCEFNWSVQHRL